MRKMPRQMMSPRPTTPPTDPPTIAPMSLLDEPVSGGGADSLGEADELGDVDDADAVEELDGVLEAEPEPPTEDSGWVAAACASEGSNTSVPTTLRYAQAGMAVAPGMARG